jgi:hypothetical protein
MLPCCDVSRLAFKSLNFDRRVSGRNIMRRSISNIIRRLLGSGGYTVINSVALKELQQNFADAKASVSELRGQLADAHSHIVVLRQELARLIEDAAETKAGVSALQGQSGETHSHIVVLRQELARLMEDAAETKAGVSALQGQSGETHSHIVVLRQELASLIEDAVETKTGALSGVLAAQGKKFEILLSPQYGGMRDVPSRLDVAATSFLINHGTDAERAEGERRGLASHYARSASVVSRHWLRQGQPPPDPYPKDDLSLQYALSSNVFIPGEGNDLEIDPHRPSFPWRHLFTDPRCGVFLILGQSNAANHGGTPYTARGEVYGLDFLRMRCFHASDPLPGASGTGGSIWSRLGDLLIEKRVFERTLFVPLAFGGAYIVDWIPGGKFHGRTALALSRLRKDLSGLLLPFSAVLWQQGEAEANHTRMSALTYTKHFHDIVGDLRNNGVFAPVFVAQATKCDAGPHPYENRPAIREAQSTLPDPSAGVFPGPDTDSIGASDRYDGCHLSEKGLRRCSELWFNVLSRRRDLLRKP